MGSTAADADREERFKHLLQPIRDLAQNWDVDIATSLEDYLEDLEEITITLDDGASKVNFAEAALLIQGSTCVYSRKVEHVHQLVLRTIDFLMQQKHQSGGGNGSKGSTGDDDMKEVDDETVFLSLDDMLDEGKHIDLERPSRRGRGGRRSSMGVGAVTVGVYDGGFSCFGDDEKEPLVGSGRVSEISRPPMFLMEQDYGNSFKMSTCAVDPSGALLIDGAKADNAGASGSSSSRGGILTGTRGTTSACDFWGGVGVGREEASPERGWGGIGDGFGNDGDSDDGAGGLGYGPCEDYGDGDNEEGVVEKGEQGVHTPTAANPGVEARELRGRPTKESAATTAVSTSSRPNDPWRLLDPHDPGPSQARPISTSRTYRFPPQLRRRRGSNNEKEGVTETRSTWLGLDGKLAVSIPIQGLAFPEFQYVAEREKQRKANLARLARRQAREFMGRDHLLAVSTASMAGASSIPNDAAATVYDGADAADYGGYGSDGGYSSDDGGGGYGDLGEAEENGDGEVEAGDEERVAPISLEDAFRDKPQTYEDLCRSHIEAFMRGTEKYAHETQLSKRVGAWQDKLEPLMRSQEKRQAFDIHKYGKSVLTKVASMLPPAERVKAQEAVKGAEKMKHAAKDSSRRREKGVDEEPDISRVDFGAVVNGKERFDVCRIFLASLQLANNGNVRLFHGVNAAEQASTPFQLELLSLQEADNMSGQFAPSVPRAEEPAHAPVGTGVENAEVAASKASKASKGKAKPTRKKGGRGRGAQRSPTAAQWY